MELNYLMLLLVVFVVLAVWATVFWNKVTRQREEADKKLLLAHDLSAKANSILNSLDQEKEKREQALTLEIEKKEEELTSSRLLILAAIQRSKNELEAKKVAFEKTVSLTRKEIAKEREELNALTQQKLKEVEQNKLTSLAELARKKQDDEAALLLERKKLQKLEKDVDNRKKFTEQLTAELDKNHIQGRKWLSSFISNAFAVFDKKDADYLARKKRPALKASETVKALSEEKRELRERVLFLESQLKTYQEYFPFLLDYEEEILNDIEDFRNTPKEELERVDPVKQLLSNEEYNNLSTVEKNQLALNRFLSNMSSLQVGKMYERYIGWLMEKKGYSVQYDGLLKGFEDRGRDLIVKKKNSSDVQVIQAKCWSKQKTIHEKHIFQLFGTTYELQQKDPEHNYIPIFYTTTDLSEYALKVADLLGVKIVNEPLQKDFPMIKCNIGSNGEKIYHLPFDQQYDKTRIDKKGEFYAKTTEEAEKKGFRRAFKWHGIEV